MPALEVGARTQRSPEDRHVLAHHGERLVEGEPEHRLHRGAVAHADAEREAPARRLGERERGLGHRDRMAGIDRDDAHAEAEARGGRAVRGEDEERVATEAVGDPHALVAERLGAPGELHGGVEVAPRHQVGGAPQSRIHDSASGIPDAARRRARSRTTLEPRAPLGARRSRPSTSARR